MKHFNDAIVAHERFNASAWQDLHHNPNPERPIIVFLDYDTCQLYHWSRFPGREMIADIEGGREQLMTYNYSKECSLIEGALRSPALSSPDSRLVVVSCKDEGPERHGCLGADRNTSGIFFKLIVGHLGGHRDQVHPLDFGMPSWPIKAVALNSIHTLYHDTLKKRELCAPCCVKLNCSITRVLALP